jgi:alkane 1-monooxygenase
MFHYLKFTNYFITTLLGVSSVLLAQYWILLGFGVFIIFYIVGDTFFGEDLSQPNLTKKWALDAMLYASVPTTFILMTVCIWLVTPFNWPIMHWLSSAIGYDFVAAKANTHIIEILVAVVFCGLMLSGIATVVGHELIHRIGNKKAITTGRWLLSLSFDASFSIEHVFNHHIHVATENDPVTAPRGRSIYKHVPIAIWGTNKSAWQIEAKRLKRKKKGVLSLHNQYITGWLMTAAWLGFVFLVASWQGVLFVAGIGLVAKVVLEIVNYMEHYGLVRHPRERVMPKHSWNTNRRISCWAMFNLPRHSHHHAKGAVPFEKLEAMPDAPVMIGGYISTIVLVLLPPLWYRLMRPKLQHWDDTMANENELSILRTQQGQGIPTNANDRRLI